MTNGLHNYGDVVVLGAIYTAKNSLQGYDVEVYLDSTSICTAAIRQGRLMLTDTLTTNEVSKESMLYKVVETFLLDNSYMKFDKDNDIYVLN